jgi:hypothetical protein
MTPKPMIEKDFAQLGLKTVAKFPIAHLIPPNIFVSVNSLNANLSLLVPCACAHSLEEHPIPLSTLYIFHNDCDRQDVGRRNLYMG